MRERFSKIWVMAGLLVMGLPPSLALGSDGVNLARISEQGGVTPTNFIRATAYSWDMTDVRW